MAIEIGYNGDYNGALGKLAYQAGVAAAYRERMKQKAEEDLTLKRDAAEFAQRDKEAASEQAFKADQNSRELSYKYDALGADVAQHDATLQNQRDIADLQLKRQQQAEDQRLAVQKAIGERQSQGRQELYDLRRGLEEDKALIKRTGMSARQLQEVRAIEQQQAATQQAYQRGEISGDQAKEVLGALEERRKLYPSEEETDLDDDFMKNVRWHNGTPWQKDADGVWQIPRGWKDPGEAKAETAPGMSGKDLSKSYDDAIQALTTEDANGNVKTPSPDEVEAYILQKAETLKRIQAKVRGTSTPDAAPEQEDPAKSVQVPMLMSNGVTVVTTAKDFDMKKLPIPAQDRSMLMKQALGYLPPDRQKYYTEALLKLQEAMKKKVGKKDAMERDLTTLANELVSEGMTHAVRTKSGS